GLLKQDNKVLSIFALGGGGEIGKNMYVVQYDREMIVIDAGLKFRDAEMLGIDLVIPDISYLKEHKEKIKGVIITHGHEDHTGALTYLLQNINVPVFASQLTLGLIECKLREAGLLRKTALHVIDSDSKISFQNFKASF